MRLPATLAGIGCWLILSRCVLPRLGRTAGRQQGGGLDGGRGVPGRVAAVQQRLAARADHRVRHAADLDARRERDRHPPVGAGGGGDHRRDVRGHRRAAGAHRARATAGRRPRHRPDHRRAAGRPTACSAPIAALLASLTLILVVVFRAQTLATVAESARIKYKVGPTIAWYQDFLRYYFLTVEDSVDSSLTRRFSVLVLLLCLFGMLTVLLRRGGVPGMAKGPVWRLIGTTAVGLMLLTFTPTKWAVQFGAFAGLAGALGGGHRVRVLPGRAAQPPQPGAVRDCAAVRAGVGDIGHQRLVLRRRLRRAVVRQAAGDREPSGDDDVPGAGDRDRSAGRLAALPDGLHRAHRGGGQSAQPHPGLDSAAGGGAHHGGARSRVDGQGRRGALSRLHHREGQHRHACSRRDQLRDGRRRAGRTRHERRDAATGLGPAVRPVRAARRGPTRSGSPRTGSATPWSRPSPSPPTPAPSTPTAHRTNRTSGSASPRAPAAGTARPG